MKVPIQALVAGAFLLLASQLFAQESGVSHPETLDDTITVSTQPAPGSALAPTLHARPAETVITVTPKAPTETAEAVAPSAPTAPQPAAVLRAPAVEPADEGIVASRPFLKNALAEGTIVRARLNEQLSSKSTVAGTRFTAQLASDVLHDGKVVLPAGSVLAGRVTSVHAARRIGGSASLHLEPETVALPDGSFFQLNARVIDTGDYRNHRVNSEGTILHSEHGKATAAALGLTTASAATAGAVLGGGAGAAVGAGIGAGVGAVWWLRRDRQETLEQGTELIFSLDRPMTLTPTHY